ncbi:MAG: hypothetical protein IPM69_16095 [Ignavibacteria bacterium]|nr:hypothetical protein [Ignavibacteria bacterium]
MKHTIFILLILALTGCEIFTVGSKRPPVQEINQRTSVGAVYLFKSELDSNNTPAATEVLARPNGNQLLAIEKYELYDEMNRLGRLIAKKPITLTRTDTISTTLQHVKLEFNYQKKMTFTTQKIADSWYIVDIAE